MLGATEYARLFKTGQYGRLYLVSGCHARGETFHIYVLPEGEEAIPNGSHNAPLNKDKVEVYGILGGQSGWTEWYGWLHEGRWQLDFEKLVAEKKREIADKKKLEKEAKVRKKEEESKRINELLSDY